MTDFYRVDPRFGQLEEYVLLAEEAQKEALNSSWIKWRITVD